MYKVITSSEKQEWDKIINLFDNKDVYYSHAYCILYELIGDGEPHLFFYENGRESMVCYPFIKRKIDLQREHSVREILYDIVTPYGYGGPLVQNTSEQVMREFRKEFNDYCQEEKIVSEFIRFHPFVKNHQYLEESLNIEYNRDTIYIDLTKDEREIVANYHKNHRRNIKKAFNNKLEFKILEKEEAIQRMDDFYQLYIETMDKLHADQYYYFSIDYMKEFLSSLENNSMIASVFFENKMISAALCMYGNGYLHYHLGCSKQNYLYLGTNVFLFHNVILWGKLNHFHTFHLGGGRYSNLDSLFQFKYKFNSEGKIAFRTGKKIYNPGIYNDLVKSWEQEYNQKADGDFFPLYRAKPLKNALLET